MYIHICIYTYVHVNIYIYMHVEIRGILYGSVIEPHPHAELEASFCACCVYDKCVAAWYRKVTYAPSAHLYFSRSLATGLYSCKYMYICTHIGIHICIYVYIYIYIYIFVYVCTFMYVHVYVYIHIYIYTYVYYRGDRNSA